MNRQQESAEIEVRWKEFWQDHKDFDSRWARNVLHDLSEFLPFVFKSDATLPGLKQLYKKSGIRLPRDFDWAKEWTDLSLTLPAVALRELPIFQLALALRAYAYYGLILETNPNIEFPDVFEFLGLVETSFIPRQWGGDAETDQTITAALARSEIDFPEKSKGLTPEELAALARVSRKSVMNLLAPGRSGILQKNSEERITIESANRWLLSRSDFRPSIWQQQKSGASSHSPNLEPSSIHEPQFVPVAEDGSWFSPTDRHRQDSRFYVGNGDDEQKFDNYWTALDFLARAASPRWRYADAAGRWRFKKAVGWERKARGEIEKLISEAKPSRNNARIA